MDMVFNYLPDVFCYQSVRNHNYGNSWLNETTNEGELKYNTQTTATSFQGAQLLGGGGGIVGVWCRNIKFWR
jgi:hypothetical protein